jgi:hypothetical protein
MIASEVTLVVISVAEVVAEDLMTETKVVSEDAMVGIER